MEERIKEQSFLRMRDLERAIAQSRQGNCVTLLERMRDPEGLNV